MTVAIGGSIIEVSLDGRVFEVAADAESQRKLGGWENEVMASGSGGARIIKTRVPLKLDGLALVTNDARGDAEYLQKLAGLFDFFPITVTFASLITYGAIAMITGEVQTSSQAATTPVTLEGPGGAERL